MAVTITNAPMIKVDGVAIKTPSTFSWSINEVSASSAGRDATGYMYKERITRKRKIQLAWNAPTPQETQDILNAFSPQYFKVTYYDPLAGRTQTRNFYAGDQSAPVRRWTVNNKIYEQVSFDIIER